MKYPVAFILITISLFSPTVSTIAFGQNRTSKAVSPARTYSNKYLAVRERFFGNLGLLIDDFRIAYSPISPYVKRMMPVIDGASKGDAAFKQRLISGFEEDYLKTTEGRNWVNRRNMNRAMLAQTMPSKLAPLRRDLKRLSELSPVPLSMKKADDTLINATRSMNSALDVLKLVPFGGADWFDSVDQINSAVDEFNLAEDLMAVSKNKSKKIYIPG